MHSCLQPLHGRCARSNPEYHLRTWFMHIYDNTIINTIIKVTNTNQESNQMPSKTMQRLVCELLHLSFAFSTAFSHATFSWTHLILSYLILSLLSTSVCLMSQTAVPTWQPPDGHAPPPKRTSPASHRLPRMGTR